MEKVSHLPVLVNQFIFTGIDAVVNRDFGLKLGDFGRGGFSSTLRDRGSKTLDRGSNLPEDATLSDRVCLACSSSSPS